MTDDPSIKAVTVSGVTYEMGDVGLLREALEALKPTEQLIASMLVIGATKTRGIEVGPALETVSAVITKLEERLLRE